MKRDLTDSETATLHNALMTAADKFDENAKMFRALIDAPAPAPDEIMAVRGAAAKGLAEQFDGQAEQAREMAYLLTDAETVTLDLMEDLES